MWSRRYLILRRVTQLGILLIFAATFRWGFEIVGVPVLRGNLSASELLGVLPLADPFAAIQILLTRHLPEATVLTGALIVLVFYALIGGRTFCSWVCPVNPVADLAAWLRRKLGWGITLRIRRDLRWWVLGLAFGLSALLGVAAFEWISPIGMAQRSLIFGMGAGWLALAVIFLFDLLAARQGWCGHLCPLGAFYSLVGRVAQLRVRFDDASCTRCGDCVAVCPEPHVLNFKKAAETGMILSGDCTNCGRCTPICPEGSLSFALKTITRRAS